MIRWFAALKCQANCGSRQGAGATKGSEALVVGSVRPQSHNFGDTTGASFASLSPAPATRLGSGPDKPGPGDSRLGHRFSRIWRISTDFSGVFLKRGQRRDRIDSARMASGARRQSAKISPIRGHPRSIRISRRVARTEIVELCVNDRD